MMGAAAAWVYRAFVAAESAKLALVVKCCGVGLAGMVLYLICMGPMVPTREILSKLRGKKR